MDGPLSSLYENGGWVELSLAVEADDSIMDGAVERVCVGESMVGEIVLLEVAPTSLDIVQLGGVFRQPFEGEPRTRKERLCCELAAVDWSVVENRD